LLAAQLENITDQNGSQLGGLQAMEGGGLQFTLGASDDGYSPIDVLDISLGMGTIFEIVGLSLLLTTLAAFAAIINITKYEPIKILMERE
jgi:putative ABC transport system permease protein